MCHSTLGQGLHIPSLQYKYMKAKRLISLILISVWPCTIAQMETTCDSLIKRFIFYSGVAVLISEISFLTSRLSLWYICWTTFWVTFL